MKKGYGPGRQRKEVKGEQHTYIIVTLKCEKMQTQDRTARCVSRNGREWRGRIVGGTQKGGERIIRRLGFFLKNRERVRSKQGCLLF